MHFSGPWYPYKHFTLYGLQQESSESMLRVTLLTGSSVSAAMIHTHILKKIVITKGRVFNKVRELFQEVWIQTEWSDDHKAIRCSKVIPWC